MTELAAPPDAPPHVLVVDDDRRLRELLDKFLTAQGFRVHTATNGVEARSLLAAITMDVIVMDVMMPGEDGISLTAALRDSTDTPVLMLTAMGNTEDRIRGLEAGADDYLAKPFEPRELVLRLRSILKRATTQEPEAVLPEVLALGSCTFDRKRAELRRRGVLVKLAPAQLALLSALAANAGTPMSRETLAKNLSSEQTTRAIDVHVTRLRRKLEDDPRHPQVLRTVRGKGYMLTYG